MTNNLDEEDKVVVIDNPKELHKGVNLLYKDPKFLDRLAEYYEVYMSFNVVAKRLKEEFGCNISPDKVRIIYRENIGKEIATEKKAGKFFEDSFIRMQKRYEECWEMIGDLVLQYKRFRKIMNEKDDMTQAVTFMKMSGQIVNITTEIRKQLEFVGQKQEEIRLFQQNNLIISPLQINQEIKKIFSKMSKEDIQAFFRTLGDKRFAEGSMDVGNLKKN